MIRSLNLLSVGNKEELENSNRISKLFWNKSISDINFSLVFIGLGITILIALCSALAKSSNSTMPDENNISLLEFFIFLIFPLIFIAIGIFISRKIYKDPLRLYLKNPYRYSFAEAKLQHQIFQRGEKKGNSKYLILGVFLNDRNQEINFSETFSPRIWDFNLPTEYSKTKGQKRFLPAYVIYEKERPENASLVGIDKSAIEKTNKKHREDRGNLLVTIGLILFFLLAAFFFSL